MKSLVVFLSCWFAASSLSLIGAEKPAGKLNAEAELGAPQTQYRETQEKLGADFAKWSTTLVGWYRTNLEKLQTDTAKAGDLDGAVAIKAERERVAASAETTPEQVSSMPPGLRALRGTYEASLKKITDEVARRDAEARRKYLGELEALQKRITMAGEIDEALKVKAERERFAAERPSLPSPLLVASKAGELAPPKAQAQAPAQVAEAPQPTVRWRKVFDSPEQFGNQQFAEMSPDGWIVRRDPKGPLWARAMQRNLRSGAIRAQFRWAGGPDTGALQMISEAGGRREYWLRRKAGKVELSIPPQPPLGTFDAPTPRDGDLFTMELRVAGAQMIAKLNDREIINVPLEDNGPFMAAVAFASAAVRNIEVMDFSPAPAPAAVSAGPRGQERWVRTMDEEKDHPANGVSIQKDGWVTKRPGAKYGTRDVGERMRDGAVRAEFRWTSPGQTDEVTLRGGEAFYRVKRSPEKVELLYHNNNPAPGKPKYELLGSLQVASPPVGGTYQLEFRAVGPKLTVKLDGKEVLSAEDTRVTEGAPSMYLRDHSAVRNFEVLYLDPEKQQQ